METWLATAARYGFEAGLILLLLWLQREERREWRAVIERQHGECQRSLGHCAETILAQAQALGLLREAILRLVNRYRGDDPAARS